MRRAAWIISIVAVVVIGFFGVRRAVRTASPSALREAAGIEPEPGDSRADGVSARVNDSAARRVRASIVDDDGEPLEGGHVSLRCLFEDEVIAIPGNTWPLDESGAFEGPGCLGVVCVDLHHASAVPAEPWSIVPGEPTILRATTLPRLLGSIVDARDRPIAAARITVRAVADADLEAIVPTIGTNTTTDVDGVFSFALVQRPPCDPCTEAERGCDDTPLALHDRVLVAVHADDFAPARVEVEVGEGEIEVPPIRLSPPQDVLSGTLLDPNGDPYPRATVIARASNDPSEQHQTEIAGESFAFESLGRGPYDLRALQDGVELATAKAAKPGEDVELVGSVVAAGPDILVEITKGGQPLAGISVDGGPFRGARTDVHGQVRADAAMPGPYMLALRAPGAGLVRRALTIPHAPATDVDAPSRLQLQIEL